MPCVLSGRALSTESMRTFCPTLSLQDESVSLMSESLAKLSILNYETDYCEANDVLPFNPGSFVTAASNPGCVEACDNGNCQPSAFTLSAQHDFADYNFSNSLIFVPGYCHCAEETQVSANLMTQTPREPSLAHSVCSLPDYVVKTRRAQTIHLELNSMGMEPNFPATALRAAHGEPACRTLSYLCDAALTARHFVFRRAEFIAESAVEEGEVDISAEVVAGVDGGGGISDDISAVDDEEEVLFSEVAGRGGTSDSKLEESVDPSMRQVMKAAVAPAKWRAEVERVAPKLRFKAQLSGREWRTHLEATRKHKDVLAQVVPDTYRSLEKISADVGGMVERVSSKERFINTTFQALAQEYKAVQDSQDGVTEKHKEASDAVSSLTNDLAVLSDELEELTGSLDDRGASITDTSPLVKIKAALAKLRAEIREMDTRVGVLGHRLMQHKLAASLARAGKTRAGGRADEEEGDSDDELDIEDDEL